ncbi:DNA polymerase IV [Nakamurella aerolata]|uniref:DNA polymerase IV n=1 Tax=Nakamurella aerolata TaxID=1656892 RepID=A0A849A946_9ACTN|nr:DNA polymerase IV [Nakamurella aerolata]NNG36136.1 DNA polymerase IV [Nakamurella aerolata]
MPHAARRTAAAGILHADLDSFYASVEQRDQPALRGRPVAVGGGIVLAASYEAKACGVSTPMGSAMARALCPELVEVPPRFSAYTEASRAVFKIFRDTTPLVEPVSIDEAFLDVGGLGRLAGSPEHIAHRLRQRVRAEVGLPISVGIARTKFLAKVASGSAKPDGLLLVPPDGERAFLHPLPVERLWGVGKVTADKLHTLGLRTVADVAATDTAALIALLGAHTGRHLAGLAALADERVVQTRRRRKSIGAQHALGRGRHTRAELDGSLTALVDRVVRRLRTAGRRGRTVTLRLRFADFQRVTRSTTRWDGTDSTAEVLAAARGLLDAAGTLIAERGVTLIGVAVSNLDDAGQPALPFPGDAAAPPPELDTALDAIRDRFGSAAVGRAALLGRDSGLAVPLLPD